MPKFLVDVNLPKYFSLWKSEEYIHVADLDDTWTDLQVWNYARENDLTIVTKDTDFHNFILLNDAPPKVIHLKIGNMRLRQFHEFLSAIWEDVENLSAENKLVTVYIDRIEALK